MSPRFSQLIFDLDGTLIDSAPDLHRAVNRMLGQLGAAPLSLAQVRGMVGDGAGALIERVLAAAGQRTVPHAEAVRSFLDFYAQDPVGHTQLYPGVREGLDELAGRGLPLSVCTNKPEGPSRDILAQLDLARYFGRVIGGDTFPYRKPDPRMLLSLLEPDGVPPDAAALVGDSEVDAATAVAAGVPFFLVTYGYHRGPVAGITSHERLDDLRALPALLAR